MGEEECPVCLEPMRGIDDDWGERVVPQGHIDSETEEDVSGRPYYVNKNTGEMVWKPVVNGVVQLPLTYCEVNGVVTSTCGHRFHRHCVRAALEADARCPICRGAIDSDTVAGLRT